MTEILYPDIKKAALETIIKRGDNLCLKLTGYDTEKLKVVTDILEFNLEHKDSQISQEDLEFLFSKKEVGTDNKDLLFDVYQMRALSRALQYNATHPESEIDDSFLSLWTTEDLSNAEYAIRRTPVFSGYTMYLMSVCMEEGYPIKDYVNLLKYSDSYLSDYNFHITLDNEVELLKKTFDFQKSKGIKINVEEVCDYIHKYPDTLAGQKRYMFDFLLDVEEYNAKHPHALINLKDVEEFLNVEPVSSSNNYDKDRIYSFMDILIYNASHPDKHIDVNRFFDIYKESKRVWSPPVEYMDEGHYINETKFSAYDMKRASDVLIFEAECSSKQTDIDSLITNVNNIYQHIEFRRGQGKRIHSYDFYYNLEYLDILEEALPINREYYSKNWNTEESLNLYPLVNMDKEGNVTLNENVKKFVILDEQRSERNLDDERDEL